LRRIIFIILSIMITSYTYGQEMAYPAGDSSSTEKNIEVRKDKCSFVVTDASIGQWGGRDMLPGGEDADEFFPATDMKSMTAVRFSFFNRDETRKIDLVQGFNFFLEDEHGNVYRPLGRPSDYEGATIDCSRNFPSLYPGERYAEVLFFEAPIAKCRYLILSVDANSIGYTSPVEIEIPIDRVKDLRCDCSRPDAPAQEPKRLSIISPREGKTVNPGETIAVRVQVTGRAHALNKLVILSPTDVLEDSSLAYGYRVTVPSDHPKGSFTVIVIGQWLEDGEETLLSDLVTLEVVDPSEKCVENCVKGTKVRPD